MPLTALQTAAIGRMAGYYEGDNPYNAQTNPGGFRQGGQVVNFVPALKDVALAVQGAATLVTDALSIAPLGLDPTETDIASAATTDIGAVATIMVRITGAVGITSFGAVPKRIRFLRFTGALTLTHDATKLILPGAVNLATAAGDTCTATSDGAGVWTVRSYQRADGSPIKASVAFRNRLINGNLVINQRGATTASTSYAAGAYVMDRWKAGSGGCTLSWSAAANGDVTASITAGTLVQVIEGSRYLLEGGAYVLSWSGTATARIWQGSAGGSYAASPVAVTGLTAATNAVVEFSTGTLTLAQFEPGVSPTAFERRDDELRRCQRYYETGAFKIIGNAYTPTALVSTNICFKETKRVSNPAVSQAIQTYDNSQGFYIAAAGVDMAIAYLSANNAGNATASGTFTASAEL